jgi:type I restriction enzyme S subunit
MELKAGYKNTEVGVIPDDWEVKTIKGITTDMLQGVNTAIDIPEYVESGYPMLKANNIIDGEVNFSTSDHISEKTYQGYSDRFRIKKNDFLFSNIGARLGTGSLMKTSTECSFAWNVMRIIPNQKIVKPEYLGCIMNSPALYKEIKKNESGSGMGFVPKNVLQNLTFPIPKKLEEQTAIATALSDADALINGLEKLITKKRNIKQGAMQKLLKPKEGWEVKKLGDFLDYEQPTEYLVSDTEYNDNNQTPVLTAGKTFILGYTNEEHGIFKNLPVIIFDDFTTAIKYVDFPFKAKSSAMKMLIPKNDKVNLRFVFEIMLQIKYQVADHKRHWIGEFSKLEITVPPTPEEQNKIATILSDMDAEITALQTKLEKYKKLKLGMMQNLLTGRIRLV